MSTPQPGGRFVVQRPLKLGRDVPRKMADRDISEDEIRLVLDHHVIVDVLENRHRYVLLGRVGRRPLIVVVADDELDDATVIVSVYEPDREHGWTPTRIERTLRGDEPEEAPR